MNDVAIIIRPAFFSSFRRRRRPSQDPSRARGARRLALCRGFFFSLSLSLSLCLSLSCFARAPLFKQLAAERGRNHQLQLALSDARARAASVALAEAEEKALTNRLFRLRDDERNNHLDSATASSGVSGGGCVSPSPPGFNNHFFDSSPSIAVGRRS